MRYNRRKISETRTRRSRSSLTERQVIRKIARIIRESEEMAILSATFLGHDVELDLTGDYEDKAFSKDFDLPEGFNIAFEGKLYRGDSFYSLVVILTDSEGEIVSDYTDHSIGRDEVAQRFVELGKASLENVEWNMKRRRR